MPLVVCGGALMMCSFGMAPSTLNVLPTHKLLAGKPVANIRDNVPMLNVAPFGMCMSMANPTVAAATAAAMGVLTPMPCIPNTSAPWVPGAPTVMVDGMPAVDANSLLMCSFGGVIQVTMPGQFTTMVP